MRAIVAFVVLTLGACASRPEPKPPAEPQGPSVDLQAVFPSHTQYRPAVRGTETVSSWVELPRGAYRPPGWYDPYYPRYWLVIPIVVLDCPFPPAESPEGRKQE